MKIEIKNRWNGEIILCGEYGTIRDCLQKNRGANLWGAKGVSIIKISGSIHALYFVSGKICIGCENHTVKKWLKDYKEIGKRNNYTTEQIKEYGEYIKMCAKFAPPSGKEEV